MNVYFLSSCGMCRRPPESLQNGVSVRRSSRAFHRGHRPDPLLRDSAPLLGHKTGSCGSLPALGWSQHCLWVETPIRVSHPRPAASEAPEDSSAGSSWGPLRKTAPWSTLTPLAQFLGILLPGPLMTNFCNWLKLKSSVIKSGFKALVLLSKLHSFWSLNVNQV